MRYGHTYINIADQILLLQLLNLCCIRELVLHQNLLLTHRSRDHKEEQNHKDNIRE